METPASPFRAAGLAVAGFVLLGAAYLALAAGFFGGGRGLSLLGNGLALAGLACHVAALGLSLRAWRATGRTPRIALFYAALGVAALAWWAVGRQREADFFQDNPGVFTSTFAGDGVDVRDARGVWHVAFSECPGAFGLSASGETRSRDGRLDVVGAGGVMRLHVAERRVECRPGPPGPAS